MTTSPIEVRGTMWTHVIRGVPLPPPFCHLLIKLMIYPRAGEGPALQPGGSMLHWSRVERLRVPMSCTRSLF